MVPFNFCLYCIKNRRTLFWKHDGCPDLLAVGSNTLMSLFDSGCTFLQGGVMMGFCFKEVSSWVVAPFIFATACPSSLDTSLKLLTSENLISGPVLVSD